MTIRYRSWLKQICSEYDKVFPAVYHTDIQFLRIKISGKGVKSECHSFKDVVLGLSLFHF